MHRTDVRPILSRRAISERFNRSPSCRRTSSAFCEAVRGRPWGRPSLRACAIPARGPLAEHLPLELGEARRHPHHGTVRRGRRVESLRQGHETDAQFDQFPQRYHQVKQQAAPAVQPSHHHDVDLALPRRLQRASRPGRDVAPGPTSSMCLMTLQSRPLMEATLALPEKTRVRLGPSQSNSVTRTGVDSVFALTLSGPSRLQTRIL